MHNSQASINNYSRDINKKQRELNSCRYNRCNQINRTIRSYERSINAISNYIDRSEKMYKKNKCDSI